MPRSIYALTGAARSEWQHSIPAVGDLRYSITFRTMRAADSLKETRVPKPTDHIKHLIVLMLENRSFDHMVGYLTIDEPNVPGDKIDGLKGDEMNVDSRANPIPASMDARYAGDYRVDPGHHFPDVTQQLFEKEEIPSTAKPTMGGFVQNYELQPGGTLVASRRVMKCFDPKKLPALTTLAREFARTVASGLEDDHAQFDFTRVVGERSAFLPHGHVGRR